MRPVAGLVLSSWMVIQLAIVRGQDPPADQPDARPTGLPSVVEWTFNFEAGWGTFGYANPLFTNPRDEPSRDLSRQWFEGYATPALSARWAHGAGELYGKLSAVGERTYGAPPAPAGSDASSFQVEDLHIGWRSDTFDVTVGRARYELGHGFLVYDGAGDGGSRGGYWSNPRKAFAFAAIGRFIPRPHRAEVFYLDKDEVPEGETGSRVWGANYEVSIGEQSTLGVTFMKLSADPEIEPARDGLNVFNARAYSAPIRALPSLSFEAEYALEDNGDVLRSTAWTLLGAYQLNGLPWMPLLSYRYAFFQGDDEATPASEAFDPLFQGFYDWGTWWQGEIAGEYFLSNSNLISHQLRAHFTPRDVLATGLILYKFKLDEPASYAPGVTDGALAVEADWYTDWTINKNVKASFVAAYAQPRSAVRQAFGRTDHFVYGMIYLTYGY